MARETITVQFLTLRQLLEQRNLPEDVVVAVVGAGHVRGMHMEWDRRRGPAERQELEARITRSPDSNPALGFTARALR